MKNTVVISPEGRIKFPPVQTSSTQVIDFYGAADGVRTRDNWNHNPRFFLRSNPTKSRVSAFLGGRICQFFAQLYTRKSVVVSVLFPPKRRLASALTVALALLPTVTFSYYGSYDPTPFRSRATITVVDTPVPNIECAKQAPALLVPVVIATFLGCSDPLFSSITASITPSPFWIHIAHALNTPQGIIGHELRHIFDGRFHGNLPFTSGVRYTPDQRRELLHRQHGNTVLVERCGDENCLRVLSDTEEADCTFFTRTEDVSYFDMGRLFMACWDAHK